MSKRVSVRKTYKLYVGGKFPRSESGRTYLVTASDGSLLANAARASRKDVRDAVAAARKAQPGWAGATAYLRGQITYRVAEMVEGRRGQFIEELRNSGATIKAAEAEVDATVDRLVWYAGWADKLPQVLGGANPVAGPFFNHSTPEPVGVAAMVAPQNDALLGLVSVIAPAIVTGNTVVVLASQDRPLPAVALAEALATSDVPGGVVNILTGQVAELTPWFASHADVNAVDLCGVADADLARDAETAAAETLTRVLRPANPDWNADPGLDRLRRFVEIKTVWHPAGV
ncbi:aldehyde dehydrogenase family protein [Stackebrandtia nassauensis]|uniref:Aldehyde Dehydrogenase n=1 Tax=Stackebrandtia nassauensis (strain DSM 44728 / CIP 108903 / NRRL B-16338 / NBRC 102104 / LLR-40K-21) TaxID=446470 RepID=D3Q7U8_STANL|nr:aldehyde dehydrogenase family protein [Stackebrandtia nassauensis]ADD40453.1 Aldehyde Dehydrogenase [Stackebrandtia nassauensis DSM 44728]